MPLWSTSILAVPGLYLQELPFLECRFQSKYTGHLIKVKHTISFARSGNPNTRLNGNYAREDGLRTLSFSKYFNNHLSSSMVKVLLSIYILSM